MKTILGKIKKFFVSLFHIHEWDLGYFSIGFYKARTNDLIKRYERRCLECEKRQMKLSGLNLNRLIEIEDILGKHEWYSYTEGDWLDIIVKKSMVTSKDIKEADKFIKAHSKEEIALEELADRHQNHEGAEKAATDLFNYKFPGVGKDSISRLVRDKMKSDGTTNDVTLQEIADARFGKGKANINNLTGVQSAILNDVKKRFGLGAKELDDNYKMHDGADVSMLSSADAFNKSAGISKSLHMRISGSENLNTDQLNALIDAAGMDDGTAEGHQRYLEAKHGLRTNSKINSDDLEKSLKSLRGIHGEERKKLLDDKNDMNTLNAVGAKSTSAVQNKDGRVTAPVGGSIGEVSKETMDHIAEMARQMKADMALLNTFHDQLMSKIGSMNSLNKIG